MPLNPAEPARQLSHDIRWRLKSIQTMPATRNRVPFPDANWQTAYYWLNIAYQPTYLPACLHADGPIKPKESTEPTEPTEPKRADRAE
ncbi:hypothetical protein V8E54_003026 [Elaphomyces granulatus]|jgi:hypothetical protein